ncbi:MAG: hypothetical protein Q9209_007886 [Squamulea sp. 1 TL-2023]
MRKRMLKFPWWRGSNPKESLPLPAGDGNSHVTNDNSISPIPEVQQLSKDRPGDRSYTSSNASDFKDVRDKLSSDEHIRLVEISSLDAERRALSLGWIEVPLNEAPAYNALSYSWGPQTTDSLSNIKGYRLTPNLLSCLSELTVQVPGLWWIDALCIDQDNPIEKSQQVKKMRDIYARAQKLYIWLGPKHSDGMPALLTLYKICRLESEGFMDQEKSLLEFDSDQLHRLGLPRTDSPVWQALLIFLSRPYFKRMWVLQELAVARSDISIMCGELILSYQILYHAMRFMDCQGWKFALMNLARQYDIPTDLPAFHFIDTITLIRHSLQQRPLTFYLDPCRSYQSTDPRDKIIALLGLIAPGEQVIQALEPNYSQSAAVYFREVTGALIVHHRSFNLLAMVEARSASTDISLPSWVPDYSELWYNPYHAGTFVSIPGTFSGYWTSGSSVLDVQACILDEIDIVSADAGSIGSNVDATVMSWLSLAAQVAGADAWQWLSSAVDDQHPASRAFDSFWRTLIGNKSERTGHVDGPVPDAPKNYLYLFLGTLTHFLFETADPANLKSLAENWEKTIDVQRLIFEPVKQGKTRVYSRLLLDSVSYNTFFITKAGRMGMGPITVQGGDKVATFSGGTSLYFVRPTASGHRYVGHGYVHGLMRNPRADEGRPYQEINLE